MTPAKIASLCLCVALLGCQSASDLVTVCPPVPKPYTAAQEAQAAKELRPLPADSELGAMLTDYADQRAAARACRNGTP